MHTTLIIPLCLSVCLSVCLSLVLSFLRDFSLSLDEAAKHVLETVPERVLQFKVPERVVKFLMPLSHVLSGVVGMHILSLSDSCVYRLNSIMGPESCGIRARVILQDYRIWIK
jgi:hypothetical protein